MHISLKSLRIVLTLAAMSSLGAEPAFAIVNCKPLGYGTYVLQGGDTCAKLAGNPKLNFKNFAQIQTINSKLSQFSCSNAQKGQIICHPKTKQN